MRKQGLWVGIFLIVMTSTAFAKDPFEPVKGFGGFSLGNVGTPLLPIVTAPIPNARASLTLTAIFWDVSSPSALFDIDGKSHSVEVGSKIQGATVSAITEQSVSLYFKGKHFILKPGQDMSL